jgi:hypothetical protein
MGPNASPDDSQAKEPATSRWLRAGVWMLGSVLALALLVIGATALYTRTEHFHRWLQQQALAALRSSLTADVSLDRVSGSLWDELVLQNLRIRQNGVETLFVPRVTVKLGVLAQTVSYLSSSTVHVDNLALIDPTLHLVQHPTTGWNIASLKQPGPPSTLEVFLDSLHIINGRIVVTPASGAETQLTHISTTGSLASVQAGVDTDLSSLSFTLLSPGYPATHWRSSLAYDGAQTPALLSIHAADVRTAASQLRLSGELKNFSAPQLALTAQVERLAADDVRSVAPSVPLQQDLTGALHVSGPVSALTINAATRAPDGRVHVAALLNLAQTPPRYQGELTIDRLAVDKVFRLTDVSGEVNGRLSFDGATALTAGLQWRTLQLNTTFAGRRPVELLTEMHGEDQRGRAQRAVTQLRY